MRALVTGVGGFCGAHLVRRLRQEHSIEIAGLGIEGRPCQCMLDQYFQADVTDGAVVSAAIREFRPDLVFHLAGVSESSAGVSRIYEVNVTGTVHILDAVHTASPNCAVLVVGSAAEYGAVDASALPITEEAQCRPVGPYGISKYASTLAALDYARRHSVNVSVVRPFNIVGSGVPTNLVVGALIARAKEALTSTNPVVRIGDMESERDFIAASDAVDGYVRLALSGTRGQIFNICTGRPYSIRHVAETLLANSPRPVILEFDPDLANFSPVRCIYGSYEKAARTFGFEPSTSLNEALREAWRSAMDC